MEMDTRASETKKAVPFRSPKRFLADLDASTTAKVIAGAVDIALVIDDGVIKDLALGDPDLADEGYERIWRGKPWVETVTLESRAKIEDLLSEHGPSRSRWRQVNHPSQSGVDVPIRYTTVKAGKDNRFIAIGRDLRAVSSLQHRLMETHQSLEREYSRLREAEARYRMLFETMSDAVLIVDAASTAIEEVNPAAAKLLGAPAAAIAGGVLAELFAKKSQRDAERVIASALSSGKAVGSASLAKRRGECEITASAFAHYGRTLLVVRLSADGGAGASEESACATEMGSMIDALPDALIVTNSGLRVVAANRSFFSMTQLVSEGQATGRDLSNWLGRSPTELNMLVSSLKNYGVVRNFATVMRDRFGVESDVEVSAVAAPCEDEARYGFSVRSTARRLPAAPRLKDELPSSVDQVTGLVGRMPLREIVRESTDLIERLCIETALDIADDNRASAAEILGLSRQGLYSKLKRFGIDDA